MSATSFHAPAALVLTAAALAASSAMGQANLAPIAVPTVEQLAQYPRMTGFRLSPDGKRLLAIESQKDQRTVLVWETDKLSAKPNVIGASTMRISSASFLKNDMLSVGMWQPYDSRIGDEVTKTFINKLLVTDLEGKTWKEPLASAGLARDETTKRLQALAVPTVKNRMPRDPDHVVIEGDELNSDRDLFRYNVRTGEATRMMRLGDKDSNVLVDARGRAYAKTRGDIDSKGAYIATELRNPKTGDWEEHFRSHMKSRDIFEVVSRGTTAGTVILRSNVGREFAGLYEYDVEARKVTNTLFEHKYFDAGEPVWMLNLDEPELAAALVGFSYQGPHGNEVHYTDPRYDAVVKGLAQALGLKETKQTLVDVANGKQAEVTTWGGVHITISDARFIGEPTYLVRVSGLTYPTEHYLLRGQRLTQLAKEYPQIDRRALGTAQFTYYKARDGLNIPAFLTVPNPALCGPGPYAAVVHPHGGPWARDDMGYDNSGWVPLLVSRCKVVLQPQYRGSYNWGRTLWMSGDAEWGQKMQDDKDDGAKWLVSEKLADPKRIAMFGFSYGGYAAFAASVRPEGNYKCAIAGAGVSDIERIWARFYSNPFYRDRQESTVRGLSPLTKADKTQIPIMVYTGERDQIVPEIQSKLFVDKARSAGRPVEYHVLPDYAHGPAWTREIMAQQLGLIDKYLSSGCGGGGL